MRPDFLFMGIKGLPYSILFSLYSSGKNPASIIIIDGFLPLWYGEKRIAYGKPLITMNGKSGLISFPGNLKN